MNLICKECGVNYKIRKNRVNFPELCRKCCDTKRNRQQYEKDIEASRAYRRDRYRNDPSFRQYCLDREAIRRVEKKEDIAKYKKEYNHKNKDHLQEMKRLGKYKLTKEEYEKLLEEQGNKCALCSVDLSTIKGKPNIDHDHKKGPTAVRGILCNLCNTRLGIYELLRDTVGFSKIDNYLEGGNA